MATLLDNGLPVIEVPQRPLILGPFYTEMQRAIIGWKFRHGGHTVLRWCAANAVPILGDTGLVYMSKARSSDAIDCLVGATMALGRVSAGNSNVSIYSTGQRPDRLLVILRAYWWVSQKRPHWPATRPRSHLRRS